MIGGRDLAGHPSVELDIGVENLISGCEPLTEQWLERRSVRQLLTQTQGIAQAPSIKSLAQEAEAYAGLDTWIGRGQLQLTLTDAEIQYWLKRDTDRCSAVAAAVDA